MTNENDRALDALMSYLLREPILSEPTQRFLEGPSRDLTEEEKSAAQRILSRGAQGIMKTIPFEVQPNKQEERLFAAMNRNNDSDSQSKATKEELDRLRRKLLGDEPSS